MSKKAAIPVVRTGQADLDRALAAVKQNIDSLTGQARNVDKIEPLPANASLTDVIAKVNALVERLQ
jgi:hypothetical protein